MRVKTASMHRGFDQKRGLSGIAAFALTIVALMLVAPMLASVLTGCGTTQQRDAQDAIRDGIQADMSTLSNLTTDSAEQLFASDFTTRLIEVGIDPAAVYGPLFSHMQYTIDSIDVDSNAQQATANITVTNIDIAQALNNYASSLTDYLYEQTTSASSTNSDQDHIVRMASLLNAALNDDNLDSVTTSVSVDYQLEDGVWVMQDGTELRRAILGGMDPAAIASKIGS